MQVKLVYFAWVRERIGHGGETLMLEARQASVNDIVATLAARGDNYRHAFADMSLLRFACDQEFVCADAIVNDGAELAIFPPVTGG